MTSKSVYLIYSHEYNAGYVGKQAIYGHDFPTTAMITEHASGNCVTTWA